MGELWPTRPTLSPQLLVTSEDAPDHLYFSVPGNLVDDDNHLRNPQLHTQLVVGSDLVLTLGVSDDVEADEKHPHWRVDAFDSDGNWLSVLATQLRPDLSYALDHPPMELLTLAARTAERLYPTHLLTRS